MSYRRLYPGAAGTPQTQPISSEQVINSAGGYVWQVDDWDRLDRFLILGSSTPTYYASARDLTKENVGVILKLIKTDGKRVVERIVTIRQEGRAPKNDPLLFVLALCASYGEKDVRRAAVFYALPLVALTASQLMSFVNYTTAYRGWGRLLRQGVAVWYTTKDVPDLVYQVMKYQNRANWNNGALIKMSHPVPQTVEQDALFHWLRFGEERQPLVGEVFAPILARTRLLSDQNNAKLAIELIKQHRFTWEMIPNQLLNDQQVWRALLEHMPITAMIRNLAKMTSIGLLAPYSEAEELVTRRLSEDGGSALSRVHPLTILAALKTYSSGRGDKGSLTWQPSARIVDALDDAFYLACNYVKPTNRRIMLALDVSGSMTVGQIAGVGGITPREGSAAMALITAHAEPNVTFMAFSRVPMVLAISSRQRLDDVISRISGLPFGGTDCSVPMQFAMAAGWPVEAFVVYTDSETWAGGIHPSVALKRYREKTGIAAKLIVVGMVSNGFTIADPLDGGMLDVVGFDTATPAIISDFISRRITNED